MTNVRFLLDVVWKLMIWIAFHRNNWWWLVCDMQTAWMKRNMCRGYNNYCKIHKDQHYDYVLNRWVDD